MHATIFLVFVSLSQVFAVSAYSQQTKLSLNLEDARVEEVIDQIEKSTEFVFLYNKDVIDVERRVDLSVKEKNVNEVLVQVFGNTDVSWSIRDRKIFLTSSQPHGSYVPESSLQQDISVSGIVTDASGAPLPGVTIVVEGSAKGTITGLDGRYFISNVPVDATLIFSFIGMKPQRIAVDGKATIHIKMEEEDVSMDEVVVIGYGVAKKRDLTGAVASVSSEELMATAPTLIQNALRGKAAGVMVAGNQGLNDTPMIRIRGNRSISATNDPLFVIDGVPSNGGIETINPNDVSSIEILKDASATAIYGARGANGVILVTTKKGEAGKVSVEYSGYASVSEVNRWKDRVMDAAGFVDYLREGYRKYIYDGQGGYTIDPSSAYPSMDPNQSYDEAMEDILRDQSGYVLESLRKGWAGGVYDPSKVRSFDWQTLGRRDAPFSQNHNISIRGGTRDTKVYISGNFMDNEGLDYKSYRKRYTLRMNLDQNLGDRISIGATTHFSYLQYYGGQGVWGTWNPLGTPYYSPGGSGPYGLGGDVTKDGDPALGIIPNPTGETLWYNHLFNFDGVNNVYKRNRLETTLYGTVKLYEGLTYRANFGTDLNIAQDLEFAASKTQVQGFGDAKAVQKRPIDRGWTFENILNYNKDFGEHSLNATFVQSSQKSVNESLNATGVDLPIESQMYYYMQSAERQSIESGFSQWTLMSWMGRIIYGFKDNRYMLTASLRYDGSSRLAEGNKWVAFPSASVAWRISDEPFMKNIEVISNMKLRVGYGKTGNSAINPYSTLGKIASSRYLWGDDVGVMGYAPSSLSNNTLTWETTGQYNIGLDFGLLKGSISGSVELYKQNTYDLLMPRALPEVSGFGSITQNIGETENKGLEITLETVNFRKKDFQWTTNVQVATNREKIVSLASGQDMDIANNWYVGHPIDTYYDYVRTKYVWGYSKEDMEEIAKFNAQGHSFKPGDYRVKDLNGDYKITAEDRDFVGQRMPKWTLGIANSFTYKNFDLYVFATGMFGQTIYIGNGFGHGGRYNTRNADYWTPEHTNTMFRKPQINGAENTWDRAYRFHKGDFVRISDISLGYTIPMVLSQRVNLQRARFYVQAQNPFLFTSYFNNNPEGFTGNTRTWDNQFNEANNAMGMANYLLGVNLTF